MTPQFLSKCALPLLTMLPALASAASLQIDFEASREGRLDTGFYSVPGVVFSNAVLFRDNDSPSGSGFFGNAPSIYGAMTMYRPVNANVGATVTVAAGFTGEVSFWYSTISTPVTVAVFDASNHILAQSGGNNDDLKLLGTTTGTFPGPFSDKETGSYNRWAQYTLKFDGVASSIVFTGTALNPVMGMELGDFYIDNIVLTPVPEASSTALMLAGLAGVAAVATRRRRR